MLSLDLSTAKRLMLTNIQRLYQVSGLLLLESQISKDLKILISYTMEDLK